jgi:stress-induced-phosphoprotein 1
LREYALFVYLFVVVYFLIEFSLLFIHSFIFSSFLSFLFLFLFFFPFFHSFFLLSLPLSLSLSSSLSLSPFPNNMAAQSPADAAKARGNAAFKAGDKDGAIEAFTEAINLDPNNHVFYSNRSMVYNSMGKHDEAVADGDKAIQLKPDWSKGYSRKAAALWKQNKIDEARQCYEDGLEQCPDDAALAKNLAQLPPVAGAGAGAGAGFPGGPGGANPFGQMFGPEMWGKLAANPQTRPLLEDQALVQKLQQLQANPQLMNTYMQDPQVMQVMQVLLQDMLGGMGANMPPRGPPGGPGSPDIKMSDATGATGATSMDAEPEKPSEPEPEPEPEPELTAEEKAEVERKEQALTEKSQGNEKFVAKDFTGALEHYNKALELDPTNATYHSNRAAVYFRQKEYKQCIEECDRGIEVGKQHMAPFKLMAKLCVRKGQCFEAINDINSAIESYGDSLVHDFDRKIKNKKAKLVKAKHDAEKKAYLDPELSEQHKEKGNALAKECKWVDAIKEYTEALARNPDNYKVLSNRSFAYSKLMQWGQALADCDKCMELAPTFIKIYVRKAKVQHFLKQYHKAIETCEAGLKIDPNNADLTRQMHTTTMTISQQNASGDVDPERAREAMKDPEIQQILRDPTMNKILQDIQSDPSKAQKAMADPEIAGKIRKLIAAGILRTG